MSKILCTWDEGGEKSETDHLINMVHAMAGKMAQTGAGNWKLHSTCTDYDYVMTAWNNGIVTVKAETYKNQGHPDRHVYSMFKDGGNDE